MKGAKKPTISDGADTMREKKTDIPTKSTKMFQIRTIKGLVLPYLTT
jgi:hypothetical protein